MMENCAPETRAVDMKSADSASVILCKILIVSLSDSPKWRRWRNASAARDYRWSGWTTSG